MDLSKLNYLKDDSKQITREGNRETNFSSDSSAYMPNVYPASTYTKGESVLSPSLVFVLSGGEKKERDFLKVLIKGDVIRSLKVLFLSQENQGLQPYQMQTRWEEICERNELSIRGETYTLEEMDRAYLLSDVDEFYEQLTHVLRNPKGGFPANWIISNPCFEMWLYYCYLEHPERDLADLANLPVSKRSLALKHKDPKLVPGGMNPVRAFEHMQDAITRSREHYSEDSNSIPTLYSTQMHLMAEHLIEIMERNSQEYSELLRMKSERKDNFKKLMEAKSR
jgi:hypothetical protein